MLEKLKNVLSGIGKVLGSLFLPVVAIIGVMLKLKSAEVERLKQASKTAEKEKDVAVAEQKSKDSLADYVKIKSEYDKGNK